jgi:hypothetical protein
MLRTVCSVARAPVTWGVVRPVCGAGYVVREEGEKEEAGSRGGTVRVKDMRVQSWFDEVTYWNHATEPSATVDWLPQVLQWQELAPVVHDSISEAEFAQAEAAVAARKKAAAAGGDEAGLMSPPVDKLVSPR